MKESNLYALLRMLQISDSVFPIGAFTLSDGLETFVYDKKLESDENLKEYIESYVEFIKYNDVAVMQRAYELCKDDTFIEELVELDNLAFVMKAPYEVREGSKKLCSRFLKNWDNLCEYERLYNYSQYIEDKRCYGVHSVAVGLYAFDIGLELEIASTIYIYQKLSAVVTNAVKTVPLSQTKGQKILNESLKYVSGVVESAKHIPKNEIGLGGSMFDIEAMRHEQQYSRLYMS